MMVMMMTITIMMVMMIIMVMMMTITIMMVMMIIMVMMMVSVMMMVRTQHLLCIPCKTLLNRPNPLMHRNWERLQQRRSVSLARAHLVALTQQRGTIHQRSIGSR